MNHSLTLYLAILGGIVLAAVIAHGTWIARKTAARQPKRAIHEPVPGGIDSALADTVPNEDAVNMGERLTPPTLKAPPPVKRNQPRLDALIDAIEDRLHLHIRKQVKPAVKQAAATSLDELASHIPAPGLETDVA